MISVEGMKNFVDRPGNVEFPRERFIKDHGLRERAVHTNHKQRAQQGLGYIPEVSQFSRLLRATGCYPKMIHAASSVRPLADRVSPYRRREDLHFQLAIRATEPRNDDSAY